MAIEIKKKDISIKRHSLTNEIVAIVLALSTFILILSLVSYSPNDPSLVTSNLQKTQNWIGVIGANVAAILFSIIGTATYFLPILMGLISWRILRSESFYAPISRIVGYGLFILSVCGVFTVFGLYGGIIGAALAQGITAIIGKLGAGILLTASMLTGILLITNLSYFFPSNRFPKNSGIFNGYLDRWRKRFQEYRENQKLAATARIEKRLEARTETEAAAAKIVGKKPTISLGGVNAVNNGAKKEAKTVAKKTLTVDDLPEYTSEIERQPKDTIPDYDDEFSGLNEDLTPIPISPIKQTGGLEFELINAIPIEEVKSEAFKHHAISLTKEEKLKVRAVRSKVLELKHLILDKISQSQDSPNAGVDIDTMDGLAFEHFIAKILNSRGYKAEVTKASGDLGVDVIAENHLGKFAVQVKRYNQPVSRRAVSDAVAGKNYYKCPHAMVITNNYFTPDAVKLAEVTGCSLVDRNVLMAWIKEYSGDSQDFIELLKVEVEKLQKAAYYWTEEVVFEASRELIEQYGLILNGEEHTKYYAKKTAVITEENFINQLCQNYVLPPTDLLAQQLPIKKESENHLLSIAQEIAETTRSLELTGTVKHITPGPDVITYEFLPDYLEDTDRLLAMSNRLKNALRVEGLRIEKLENSERIGIGILNETQNRNYFRELMETNKFQQMGSKLALGLGKTASGLNYITDLKLMQHLFISGATESRRTAGLDEIITSILYKARPSEVKLFISDNKNRELENYADISHLALPIVTDPQKAINMLKVAVAKMEQRYLDLSEWNVRDIDEYNIEAEKYNEAKYFNNAGKPWQFLPHIVIIINEIADLITISAREFENSIKQISERGHQVGIHLIMATQQPSAGLSKIINSLGNIAKLISYIPAPFDARLIVNQQVVDNLIARFEMVLFPAKSKPHIYLNEAQIKETEIKAIVEHVKSQEAPEYDKTFARMEYEVEDIYDLPGRRDPMYAEALRTVVSSKSASASLLQRHLQIGYGRASAILDSMVHEGYIGEMNATLRSRPILQKAYDDLQEAEERREI